MKYEVQGQQFNSKAALQRAWRERVTNAVVRARARCLLSVPESHWFIEAAFHFEKQRARLYPDGVQLLDLAKTTNEVFISKPTNLAKAAPKCVFFQQVGLRHKCRTVSSMLQDHDTERDTKTTVAAWLRQSIQYQIDSFRSKQKRSKPYSCFRCGAELADRENHVDHGTGADSFKEIARRFGTLTLADLKGSTRTRWRKFHLKNANLTMTCRPCNLTNK